MAQNDVVKALCRRIEDRYGSGKLAAIAAGVSAGVWSQYCSDAPQNAEITIPFGRVLMVANDAERELFIELLRGGRSGGPPDGTLLTETFGTTEASADLQQFVREAEADGVITPLERRQGREKALTVAAHAHGVIAHLDQRAAS